MLRDDFPIAHILQLKSIRDIVTWLYNIMLVQVASYVDITAQFPYWMVVELWQQEPPATQPHNHPSGKPLSLQEVSTVLLG